MQFNHLKNAYRYLFFDSWNLKLMYVTVIEKQLPWVWYTKLCFIRYYTKCLFLFRLKADAFNMSKKFNASKQCVGLWQVVLTLSQSVDDRKEWRSTRLTPPTPWLYWTPTGGFYRWTQKQATYRSYCPALQVVTKQWVSCGNIVSSKRATASFIILMSFLTNTFYTKAQNVKNETYVYIYIYGPQNRWMTGFFVKDHNYVEIIH